MCDPNWRNNDRVDIGDELRRDIAKSVSKLFEHEYNRPFTRDQKRKIGPIEVVNVRDLDAKELNAAEDRSVKVLKLADEKKEVQVIPPKPLENKAPQPVEVVDLDPQPQAVPLPPVAAVVLPQSQAPQAADPVSIPDPPPYVPPIPPSPPRNHYPVPLPPQEYFVSDGVLDQGKPIDHARCGANHPDALKIEPMLKIFQEHGPAYKWRFGLTRNASIVNDTGPPHKFELRSDGQLQYGYRQKILFRSMEDCIMFYKTQLKPSNRRESAYSSWRSNNDDNFDR